MFLESLWSKLSFDLLPTLPIKFGIGKALLLFIFAMFPSYIAYAKQSIQRKRIYIFSLIDFLIFYSCFFITVENHPWTTFWLFIALIILIDALKSD